jgi:steroid delta-isomerase-like uncharacterized protein
MHMTSEDNKAIVRRQYEAINRRDLDAAVADVAHDMINHSAVPEAQGAAGLRRIFEKLFKAFPDHECICEDTVAEGDRVVSRLTMRGTNTGPLAFLHLPLPATGRRFASEHIHIARLAQGKIVEHWAGRDDIGMLRQLGVFPIGDKA